MTDSENNLKKYPYRAKGAELRALRGSRKVKEFAETLRILPKTYYRYEKGERKVPNGLLKLAYILVRNPEHRILDQQKVLAEVQAEYTDSHLAQPDLSSVIENLGKSLIDTVKVFSARLDEVGSRIDELESAVKQCRDIWLRSNKKSKKADPYQAAEAAGSEKKVM
jgi:transcriptional regulator with XRE-family HTH domain